MFHGRTSARSIHALKMEVIVKTTNSPYWQIVFAAARKAARQFGVQSLGYVGGPSEADINAEITLVEDAIAKHPDFLVIAPTSATALNPVITKAFQAGIKVIIIDSSATTPNYTSFLATDNHLGGCLAARALAAAIKSQDRSGPGTGSIRHLPVRRRFPDSTRCRASCSASTPSRDSRSSRTRMPAGIRIRPASR